MAQRGTAWHGMARFGTARHGLARRGMVWHGTAQRGTARHNVARLGTAWHSMARHRKARCSTPRHGTARQAGAPPGPLSPPWGAEGTPSSVPSSHHPGDPCPSSHPLGADGAAPALGSTQRWGGRGEAPPRCPAAPRPPGVPKPSWCCRSLAMPRVVAQAMLRQRVAHGGGHLGGPPLAHKRVTYKGLIQCLRDGGVSPIPSPPCAPLPGPRAQLLGRNRGITGCQTVRPQSWGAT